MNKTISTIIILLIAVSVFAQNYDIQVKTEIDLGQKIEQFRAVPISIGKDIPNNLNLLNLIVQKTPKEHNRPSGSKICKI